MKGFSRHGRIGGEGIAVSAEINVTSLVDVAFTLLVIFMITAPILQGGVEIAVPKAPAAPLQVSEGLVVSIDRDGQIFLDEVPVTREEFAAFVGPAVQEQGGPTVYVKGDAQASYGEVLWVIAKLNEAEIETVSLIAQPELDR
jgi:biopolymer transport protein ExbD/biopolymer transport protein TolR